MIAVVDILGQQFKVSENSKVLCTTFKSGTGIRSYF